MSARESVTSVTAILIIMAVITALEIVVPLFPRTSAQRGRRVANFGLTAIAFATSWAFTSAVGVFTIAGGPGMMMRMGLPLPAQIVVSIVALDFFYGYLAHVALHAAPAPLSGVCMPCITATHSWTSRRRTATIRSRSPGARCP